jgi:serine/threonine-protein kinase
MRGSNASDAPTTPLLVRAGTVVAGKFRVERVLAEGGMGVVVAATHLQLDRPVALKFLRADVSHNLEALARFTREAKAAAQLKSEYVAHVLDVGVTEDGTPYMVMEYLEGLSLYRVLQTHGPLGIASASEYAIQACEGLAEAHSRGIVHRDIKPDNLFLIERAPGWRSIKILDFGISKLALADPNNIATGVIMGSPCYMSPEQLRSTATVDHRTDIWSLGATLYELLTGKAAFDASLTLPELVATILHKTAIPVQTLRPAVPDGLAAVVDRCLAKDRELRFDSAAELAKALQPFATDRARSAVERAASMVPAFPISRREGETAETQTRAQVQALDTQSEMHRVDQLMGISPPQGVTTNSGLGTPSVTPTPLSMTNPPPAGTPEAPHSRRKTKQLVLVTWGLGALLVIALVAALRRKPSLPEPAAMVTPPAPPVMESVPDTVDIVVRVSPSAAQITIDGAPVSGNPFHARYPKDHATHQIRATAPGFDAKWEDVPLSHDVVVDMSLDRHTASARVAPPSLPQGRSLAPAPAVRTVSAPVRSVKRVVDNTPVASVPPPPPPARETAAPGSLEVSPIGGRPPLRPIETKNPYGTP